MKYADKSTILASEQNWAKNYSFEAARIHQPVSLIEVRHLVRTSSKIRAIGTRHSFNGIADSRGDLVDLSGLDPDFVIDPERMTVTVGAATPYGALAQYLQAKGYALHNLGSLPHISVAGAISTGTHGSGDKNGILSTAVAGLEIVGAGGDVIQVVRGDEDFDGMVVGLGAFGVVTRVTLDIQPTFDVRQDAFVNLPWEALFSNFDGVFSAAYSVNVFTKWSEESVGQLWLKSRLDSGLPVEVTAVHLGATSGPAYNTPAAGDDPASKLNPFGGIPGPWSERLSHFRIARELQVEDQIQSEYMVPRINIVPALTALRKMGNLIDPYLRTTEIRTMAADKLWLSPAFEQDAVGIHFTWKKAIAAVNALTSEIEKILVPLGARPHWGKVIHARAETIALLYPRLEAFRGLADRYDPKQQFRNTYLTEHVFG